MEELEALWFLEELEVHRMVWNLEAPEVFGELVLEAVGREFV